MFPSFLCALTSFSKRGLSLLVLMTVCGLLTVGATTDETPAASNGLSLPKAGEDAVFSLLTADPGKRVWSHYGHTGIRYVDRTQQTDIVFNYGLFDFSSPNFLSRFIKGQTDYMVGTTSFFNFMLEYQIENRGVTEQVLNLTQTEKDRFLAALLTNIQPENRCYRYNFFFKNCATMPRDLIEKAVEGKVSYAIKAPYASLREEVHHFTEKAPWTQFGIDLALGAPADKKASLKDQQFAPEVLMRSFATAIVESDSISKPLVVSTEVIYQMNPLDEEVEGWSPGPRLTCWFLCVITLAITFLQLRFPVKKRLIGLAHVWDGLLFGAGGLVGCLMYYLIFASEHPTVDVNYLAIWLHPVHLLFALALVFRSFRKKAASLYKAIQLPLCVVAICGLFFLPQEVHPALIPVLIAFLIRSIQGIVTTINAYRHA